MGKEYEPRDKDTKETAKDTKTTYEKAERARKDFAEDFLKSGGLKDSDKDPPKA